ncbi:UPF0272 protein [Anaerocolumna cellulosilytica]|uniref:Pyridinium-3,5-bisthiocarboxylic acid mononucleotide nickel insertion protein n=1 Tax=Anaerocolumna cellulosilytica TaxID=433286 RepID=A0A6S6QQ07_9FIRM|nr:LarC family nickel insertion protein [Anaerocolumna cellulosilytica]MBB5194478.1 hypothetical protein [Anaerocolumna cellulosilytica]BCJ93423.1 UPF0272 protein [Anaerocolumna cellulosilytica]
MDKKTLYLECYSGISGDMTVAALLDLGADRELLLTGLKSLQVDGYRIEISRKTISSIDACDFHVILDTDNHDHDMDYLFGHEKTLEEKHVQKAVPLRKKVLAASSIKAAKLKSGPIHKEDHRHEHVQSDDSKHSHTHGHTHGLEHSHHGHSHPHLHYGRHEHRNLMNIHTIIENSSISVKAKEIAKRIFTVIAEAEAKAHGKSLDEIHFHEVGAVDSIIDITAVAICLDNLNVGEVIVSELYEGTGHITCQHGVLPIPVPAVVNIAAKHHLKLHITNVKGELVTPTGAAIVAAIKTSDTLPKDFSIEKVGLGAGKRKYEQASFLRAMLLDTGDKGNSLTECPDSIPLNYPSVPTDKVWVLEANIDDCTGEALSVAMDTLFKNGARDVYYTPIYMKKNRPAYLLGVICTEDRVEAMEELIFHHTTTIGIRKHEAYRTTLLREIKTITTPYGEASIKICCYKDRTYYYPEGDSVKKLCKTTNLDYNTLYSLIQSQAAKDFKEECTQ